MDLAVKDNLKFEISSGFMDASLILTPVGDYLFKLEDIVEYLNLNEIKMGIDSDKIQKMIDGKKYNVPYIIARGKPAEDGADGFFEFQFDTDFSCKPVVEEDGSVDFRNVNMFVSVKKGDVLVKYTPPTAGQFGFDVRGTLIKPKRGKPLAPLRGRGFDVSEDGTTYTARIDGKVEYSYGQLEVSDVYEHSGDLDLTDGNIRFSGDVHIRGNVASGMSVEATGSVEIDGHVGAVDIRAGGDVIIKGGMQGKGKGTITAKGNLSGRFFEETKIRCEGDIETNYLLNCDTYTRGSTKVSGRQGTVVGGILHSVSGINSGNAGNSVGKATILRIGAGDELVKEYNDTIQHIENIGQELNTLANALERLDELKKTNAPMFNQNTYNRLFQTKIVKVAEEKQLQTVKKGLEENMSRAVLAKILIDGVLYNGVSIVIGFRIKNILESSRAVMARLGGDDIVIEGI